MALLQALLAVATLSASTAFVTPVARVAPPPRIQRNAIDALAAAPEAHAALTTALGSSDVLLAFADQGGNLAGKFFMGSLPPSRSRAVDRIVFSQAETRVAGATWIVRGDGSRRRRGCHADSPRKCIAAAPRVSRG